MGKFSRSKGIRNERLLRDEFIRLGYQSRRIPLSGAMEGFKGDVIFEKDGVTLTAELKTRAGAFKALYEYLARCGKGGVVSLILTPDVRGPAAVMSADLSETLAYRQCWYGDETKECKRVCRKLLNLRKMIGSANILVVRDDRKPFLYIKYYD